MDNNIEQIEDTNNRNIVHISAAEGLMTQIGEQIDALVTKKADQFEAKTQALLAVQDFQTSPLFKLREVFE